MGCPTPKSVVILTATSTSQLEEKISKHLQEGFTPVGSHQVVTSHVQKRFAGNIHRDSIYTSEYSITMISNV